MTGSPAGAGDGKSGRRVTAHVTPGCRPASWSDVDSEAAVWLGTLGPAGPVWDWPRGERLHSARRGVHGPGSGRRSLCHSCGPGLLVCCLGPPT